MYCMDTLRSKVHLYYPRLLLLEAIRTLERPTRSITSRLHVGTQWWASLSEQPEVIFRARWMYENKPHAVRGPERLSPQKAGLASDWTGHDFPLPSVAMAAAREEEALRVLNSKTRAKRRRAHRDGWSYVIDGERCAVARFVVTKLEPNLFKELFLAFTYG